MMEKKLDLAGCRFLRQINIPKRKLLRNGNRLFCEEREEKNGKFKETKQTEN